MMGEVKYEWRKREKELYLPGRKPVVVTVPPYFYLALDGHGDPNAREFADGIGVLYSIAYAIRMMPKKGIVPPGYFEYTVYPLEATWSMPEGDASQVLTDKSRLRYTMMIRQPDFVTSRVFDQALEIAAEKDPSSLLKQVTLVSVEEGQCVQMLHVGSYDNEPESFALMEQFCLEKGLNRTSASHREIYLSDPRKVAPDALKTVLRYKVKG